MAITAKKTPDTAPIEVSPKATRRRFSAKYKRRILREADACTELGSTAALLRREGLYSSHLTKWREARERGELEALSAKKRGPKAKKSDARDKRIANLKRENVKLKARLERAEILLDLQKKVAEILDRPLDENDGEK
jgi:transposase